MWPLRREKEIYWINKGNYFWQSWVKYLSFYSGRLDKKKQNNKEKGFIKPNESYFSNFKTADKRFCGMHY